MTELSQKSKRLSEKLISDKYIKDPYLIPNYEDMLKYNDFYEGEHPLLDQEQFNGIIKLIDNFPNLHKFLVENSGTSKFPKFDLPTVISADIVQYIYSLLEGGKIKEVKELFYYFVDRYINGTGGEKAIFGDFVLSYFYLLKEYLTKAEELLPTELYNIYIKYFK